MRVAVLRCAHGAPLVALVLVAVMACSSSPAAPEQAADAGATPSAGCGSYCTCMARACGGMAGYPFRDDAACLAACASFSDAERTCFHAFCTQASDGGLNEHLCEHAAGRLGLTECF